MLLRISRGDFYYSVFKNTTHIEGWRTFAYISSQCIFLPQYTLDMVEIYSLPTIKYTGRENHFATWICFFLHHQIFCHPRACMFYFREETGIFFCIFLLIVVCEALFMLQLFFMFLCFFLFACLLHRHREWEWMYFP